MPAINDVTKENQMIRDYTPENMIVWHLDKTDRARNITSRWSFYKGRQHAHYEQSWSGAKRNAGTAYLEERLTPQGIVTQSQVEIARKPNVPHGILRQIVTRFTSLLLSDISKPVLKVPADPNTEGYVKCIMDTAKAWASLQCARNYKGATGSAAIVVSIQNGKPNTAPLMSQNLWVKEWEDSPDWIPRVVIEQKIINVQQESDDGKMETVEKWQTRLWDDLAEVVYKDVGLDWKPKDENGNDVFLEVESVVMHDCGRCPVVWMQNTRSTESPEGEEDTEDCYEQSDQLDKVRSYATRATIANTDPTLVHSDHRQDRQRNQRVSKGFGAKLETSAEGKYSLLETGGASVEMAWKTSANIRQDILQTAQCVIMDPETAGSYRSAEALAQLWRSMEARAGTLRVPLSTEIQQIASIFITLGNTKGVYSMEDSEGSGIEMPPLVNEDGTTGVYSPGKGRYICVEWGPFHRPTTIELQAMMSALTMANGSKQVLSSETTTDIAVNYIGTGSTTEEMERIHEEKEVAMEEMMQTMEAEGAMNKGLDPAGDDEEKSEREKEPETKSKSKDKGVETKSGDE